MDPVSAQELAVVLGVFAAILEKMGPEGLLGLLFGGPFLGVAAIWAQTWSDRRHSRKMLDEFYKSFWELWEKHRAETGRLFEDHRKETGDILRQFDEALKTTIRYYENNVLLVQNYEKLNGELQTLIATTIRTLGHLETRVETLCSTLSARF